MRIGKKRITACLLSAALLLFTSMIPVQASTALEESIKQKQQAISDAQSEKKKIQSNISDIKSMVSQLQKSKKDLETYVAQLDGQLDDLENKIEDLEEEITAKKTEIEETKADIEQAQAVADQQYEDMKTRLRYLYRNGKGNGYLELGECRLVCRYVKPGRLCGTAKQLRQPQAGRVPSERGISGAV